MKKNRITWLPVAVMAVLLTVSGILTKQNFFEILPLYISLVVMILNSRLNRYGLLLGSLNSILYGVIYYSFGIYGSMLNAFAVSFPFQLVAFIRWTKHRRGTSSELRHMTWGQRGLTAVLFVVAWVACFFGLKYVGGNFVLVDSTLFLVGLLTMTLTIFAFTEYTYIGLANGVVTVIMGVEMMVDDPSKATYFLYSVYCMICLIVQFINAKKIYRLQQEENAITQ